MAVFGDVGDEPAKQLAVYPYGDETECPIAEYFKR